ncbi:hypothetical protein [Methanolobus sp. WCC5]|uniref:hypothetical protein n=1 Tax=Methanolobus sp. WCC5 TaxID=3125785 RepID=UPI00324E293E
MRDYDKLLGSVTDIATQIQELNRQAVYQYTPIVNSIIQTKSRDISHIERTLDSLLDFCGYDPALRLYRQLCRYYWDIDPEATVSYINAYRELWDSEDGIGDVDL